MPEVLIVIVIMGILFGIASSTWFGVVEGRRVDSATNQMVSDLRLAHTTATNRLTTCQVILTPGSPAYQMDPVCFTDGARQLPERTEVGGGISSVRFGPDGTAQVTGSGSVMIAAEDGDPDNLIEINTVTSRVRVLD